jgi:5-methylcytosine-specific restriction endonuclease McrA
MASKEIQGAFYLPINTRLSVSVRIFLRQEIGKHRAAGFYWTNMKDKDWHRKVYARHQDRITPMKRNQWRELRKKCLERDGYKCYRCEKISKSGQGLSAHHIIPRIDDGPNTLDNLVTLCHACHDYIEMQGYTTLFEIMASADNPVHEREAAVVYRQEIFERPSWHARVYGGMKGSTTNG